MGRSALPLYMFKKHNTYYLKTKYLLSKNKCKKFYKISVGMLT